MASRFADHPQSVAAQVRLISHADPALLLRSLEACRPGLGRRVFQPSPSGQWLVSRPQLELAARDDGVEPQLSLQLAHLVDALRHLGRHSETEVPFSSARWQSVTTGRTLRTSHGCVENAGFFSPLSTVSKTITHILSKVINIRCQARKFSTVTKKYIQGNDEVSHLMSAQLRQLIVCSLLGNYEHVPPSSRLSEPARSELQQLISSQQLHRWYRVKLQSKKSHTQPKWTWVCKIESSPVGRDFVLDLIQHCPLVVTNALRDFLVHVIRHDSTMLKHLDQLMRLERFTSIVNDAMTKVRRFVSMLLPHRSSCLRLTMSSSPTSPVPAAVRAQCLASLEASTDGSHKRMLDCSYRRPDLHVDQFLLALLKNSPMVQLPASLRQLSQDQQLDAREAASIDALCLQLGTARTAAERAKAMRLLAAQPDAEAKACGSAEYKALDFVTPQQLLELQQLIMKLRPNETHIMSRIVPWLQYFGVGQPVLAYVLTQFGHFHQSSLSTEKLKKRFGVLRSRQPHAYNLLQLSALLVRDVHKHNVTYQLPMHIVRHQMLACQSSIAGVDQSAANALLSSLLQYVFCSVCGTVYSLLRDYKSVYRKAYQHGLRDVSRSYCSGKIYCRRGRVTPHGSCDAQPLKQMLMLGKLLLTSGKLVMLCPQAGCCAPMVVDSERCVFNSKGVACKDCSDLLLSEPQGYAELKLKYRPHRIEVATASKSSITVEELPDAGDMPEPKPKPRPLDCVQCDVCSKWLESLVGMVIVRPDLHLCTANCAKPHVVQQLHDAMRQRPSSTKAELLQLIHALRGRRHDERTEAAAESQRHSLARSKQRNRSKRKR